MKKSDAIQDIATEIILGMMEYNIDVAYDKAQVIGNRILEKLIKNGMLPAKRDYIEHYGWKSDNTWEKE
jgi:hypothetical protein